MAATVTCRGRVLADKGKFSLIDGMRWYTRDLNLLIRNTFLIHREDLR